jgi:crotonobetainyl-CoA:carnitine CoA-transferase CaiB-like acyl-CoA transferase
VTLPLSGIRVLDLSNVLAGPFCAYQLALLGAEVIKIEQPDGGDLARRLGADPQAAARGMGISFVAVNAGKQSMTINLKHPEGKRLFRRMVADAQVVIENFRPGVMARLELDYTTLSADNSALVYCAISGFGQTGPLAQRPAYDQIIQGMAGVMSVTGDEDSAPLRVGYPVCDTIGGMTAAFAVCAALVDARASGRGRMIDVSMLEATLSTMGWPLSNYLNTGNAPTPMGNQNFTAAPSGAFRTGNGLLNIAANEERQYQSLCELLGREDLRTDPRFSDRHSRKVNRAALNAEIEAALASRGAPEWEALLIDAGVPAGQVMNVPDILAHPHVGQRGFIKQFDTSTGPQQVAGAGFHIDGGPVAPASPAPALSADTERWLRHLGYDDAGIHTLHEQGVI